MKKQCIVYHWLENMSFHNKRDGKLTYFPDASRVWISIVSWQTRAFGVVVAHRALCVDSTFARAWINALLLNAS